MWLNSLLFLLFLFGAKSDLTSVLNSGAFNYSLASAVHRSEPGTSRRLLDLDSILAPGISLNNNMKVEFKPDGNDTRPFAPQVNCDQTMATCLTFLNKLTKSILTRNSTDIRKHFSDSFHFKGCLGIHYLDKTISKLSGLSEGVFAVLEKCKTYSNDHLLFNATVYQFMNKPFNAEFLLDKITETLLEGRIVQCIHI
ncbi:unnamed protein product [Caenorhabditis brenneri]